MAISAGVDRDILIMAIEISTKSPIRICGGIGFEPGKNGFNVKSQVNWALNRIARVR